MEDIFLSTRRDLSRYRFLLGLVGLGLTGCTSSVTSPPLMCVDEQSYYYTLYGDRVVLDSIVTIEKECPPRGWAE